MNDLCTSLHSVFPESYRISCNTFTTVSETRMLLVNGEEYLLKELENGMFPKMHSFV